MKKIKLFITLCTLVMCWVSCKKEGRVDFIDPNAPAPSQISNIKITATPGGALLTYKIPNDQNFFYAKAIYEIQPGVFREAKASLFTDTLAIIGYGDTSPHEVKIYSIGKNEKESAPIVITITPQKPSILKSFESIKMDATFGGVQVSFKNTDAAKLAIELMVDTTGNNTWKTVDIFYTGATEGTFSARGFPDKEKKFGVFIRDRWNNKSDILIKTLTPFFEEKIPKDWAAYNLPTDTYEPAEASYTLPKLWDGVITAYAGIFASKNTSVLPQWFTINLKKKVVISRIRMHHQEGAHLYKASAVKRFELYGSNNPAPDGGWDNWELMGTFESFKPSGSSMGVDQPEDKNYGWFLGEEFSFNTLLPAYQYIRWKTLETYSSSGQVVLSELDLYGRIEP